MRWLEVEQLAVLCPLLRVSGRQLQITEAVEVEDLEELLWIAFGARKDFLSRLRSQVILNQ